MGGVEQKRGQRGHQGKFRHSQHHLRRCGPTPKRRRCSCEYKNRTLTMLRGKGDRSIDRLVLLQRLLCDFFGSQKTHRSSWCKCLRWAGEIPGTAAFFAGGVPAPPPNRWVVLISVPDHNEPAPRLGPSRRRPICRLRGGDSRLGRLRPSRSPERPGSGRGARRYPCSRAEPASGACFPPCGRRPAPPGNPPATPAGTRPGPGNTPCRA